ncbi:hypothetical protein [Limnohabitans sp. Bal53]|uniref:hypothetical protein n=1 Tax=Limnohabitans sp. Bal53 TaxID=1977910 RepID=UPI000D389F59|nr:hypothetical protein [Limnohabitans sp. Bal53]PUE41909.1 hypothetical protein B9Z50_07035 [Limnohabitans sp. Bal53]
MIRSAIRGLALLASAGALLVLTGCASVQGPTLPVSELESFIPVPSHARLMNDVKVRWEVRENVAEVCGRAAKISAAQAWMTPPLACAMWNVASKECVIITGKKVSHVELGHELRHCFEGNFHR